jgi:hypothetical protein
MTFRFAVSRVAALLAASLALGTLTIFSAGCGSSGDDSAAQNTGDSGSSDSSLTGDGAPIQGDGGSADGATFPSHVRPPGTFNLGMNVPSLNYYNNAAIYADLALAISGNNGPWDSAANGSNPATLDATGGPTEAASSALPTVYPSGAYTITWDGTNAITIGGVSVGNTMSAPTHTTTGSVQHNTATLTLVQTLAPQTGSGPNWFQLEASGAVSNVHIKAPASLTSSSGFFMKEFVADMQPFTTLRFMDTLNTNGNLVKNWSDRTWPDGGSRAGTKQGIAYEDVIALANETGQDVWINVPVLATDDYVCRLARLFHYGEQGDKSNGACDPKAPAGTATTATLNPNAHVYVEFTNEIWNSGFQQWEDIYCMVNGAIDMAGKTCDVTAPTSAIGVAALANASLPWTNADKYAKSTEFGLILAKRVSDIFRTVFGCASGKGCQAQIPFNVQSAYAAEVEPGFAFMKTAYGSLAAVDVMAVAPYFNIDGGDDTSVDAIFTDLTTNILDTPSGQIAGWLTGDLAEATKYGLPLVSYEGGQGLNGASANLVTAQSDARMYTAYENYFSALWDKLVGKDQLFIHYSYCGSYGQYGSWGAVVNEGDPGSQKWDALMSIARLAGDANLDGVVNADDCTIVNANYGKSPVWWMQGDFNHDGMVDAADITAMNKNISGAACTH